MSCVWIQFYENCSFKCLLIVKSQFFYKGLISFKRSQNHDPCRSLSSCFIITWMGIYGDSYNSCHDMLPRHAIATSIAASVLLGTERGRAIRFREKSMPGTRQPRDMAEAAKCLNARKAGLNAADCSRREMRGCTMNDSVIPYVIHSWRRRLVITLVDTLVSNTRHTLIAQFRMSLSFSFSLYEIDWRYLMIKEITSHFFSYNNILYRANFVCKI